MIKKTIFFLILGLLTMHDAHAYGYGKSLFVGSIQFPSILEMVPSIRVYYSGRKISCETDELGKKITFSIPEYKQRTFFCLLVAPSIEFGSHENTVPFLKLQKNCPYKFYGMELVKVETQDKKKKKTSPFEYTWIVRELNLSLPDDRIPDDTIIVRYHPDYIQSIEGGNMVEFPKIIIRPDILKLTGSEAKLHDISNRWFLAALHTDTIHDPIQSEFLVTPTTKTVLAMTS